MENEIEEVDEQEDDEEDDSDNENENKSDDFEDMKAVGKEGYNEDQRGGSVISFEQKEIEEC